MPEQSSIDHALMELQHYGKIYEQYLKHSCSLRACPVCNQERRAYIALKKACTRLTGEMHFERAQPQRPTYKNKQLVAHVDTGPGDNFVEDLERAHEAIVRDLEEMESQAATEDDEEI